MKDLPGFLVEASGRHVHLTQQAIDVLFGENLHEKSPLSQPGQYASEERVRLVTAKGVIDNVVVRDRERCCSGGDVSDRCQNPRYHDTCGIFPVI